MIIDTSGEFCPLDSFKDSFCGPLPPLFDTWVFHKSGEFKSNLPPKKCHPEGNSALPRGHEAHHAGKGMALGGCP